YRHDVRGFSSEGMPFDPTKHEAVGQVAAGTVPNNHVATEVQRGYLMGEMLFRPARVVVATDQIAQTADRQAVGAVKVEGRKLATRSAVNRPSWVINKPKDNDSTVYIVGHARGEKDLDRCKALAHNSLIPELLAKAGEINPNTAPLYQTMARDLQRRGDDSAWDRLLAFYPDATGWLEDYFWEKISTEIKGNIFDVAVLASINRFEFQRLCIPSDVEERCSGFVFGDISKLTQALIAEESGGAMLTEKSRGGPSGRCPMEPGDILTRVGTRTVEDASAARRLITLGINSRRPVDLTFVRGLSAPQIARLETVRRR
ncbi:MAG: nucleotide exchange factor GrpE, partial [Myxococcales bacterium]|nr:nucleotide exchange factor GrpE [Myxococcales bacterium]